jgi:hypothetical protein
MRTLRLASPLQRGTDVLNAQRVLADQGYLPASQADGIFGPVTANAAKAAKWRLGYAKRDVTPTYGDALHAYLTGKRKPSMIMQQRAKARKPKPQAQTVGERAADRMVRWYQAGWKEYPAGTNQVQPLMNLCRELRLSSYYANMGFPWCALGVFVAGLAEGSEAARLALRDGKFNGLYTPTIRQVAENGAYGLQAISRDSIVKGAGVLFDFGGGNGGEVDHVGLALGRPGATVKAGGQRWKPPSVDHVVCVEANTSYDDNGSQSDGGAVAIRIRPLSQIRTAFLLR